MNIRDIFITLRYKISYGSTVKRKSVSRKVTRYWLKD